MPGILRSHRVHLALVALSLLLHPGVAAAQRISFRHLGVPEGLPSSLVADIAEDRIGFVWVATSHGVSRYDGHRFRTWDADSGGLPSPDARELHIDRAQVLWAVTPDGVSRYVPERDRFVPLPSEPFRRAIAAVPSSRPGHKPTFTSIADDAAGRLWIGTDAGLLVLDRKSGRATVRALVEGAQPGVTSLLVDPSGEVWVGTQAGLFRIASNDSLRHWPSVMSDDERTPDVIRALATDSSGDLWIGTGYRGVARRPRGIDMFVRYQHSESDARSLSRDRIARIVAERGGKGRGVWIGTENGGVDYYDPRTDAFRHHVHDPVDAGSVSSNSIWALHQGATGLLWVGTFSGALNVSMPNGAAIRHVRAMVNDRQGLSYSAVTAFLEDRQGATWVATDGGGLNRLDPATGHFQRWTTTNSTLASDAVLSIAESPDGALWIGTWGGGISRFDPKTEHFTAFTTADSDIPHDNVYEVAVDHLGEVWVGTDNGVVARLDRNARTFSTRYLVTPPGMDPSSVLLLRELSNGSFAIALRDGGLTILDPLTGKQRHYLALARKSKGLSSNRVRTFTEARPGVLWIGTDRGVDRLDLATDAVTHLDVPAPANRYVSGILQDNAANLWISSEGGLTRYDPSSGSARAFTRADGIQGSEFLMRSAYRMRDGALLFGGNDGFNLIHPESIVAARPAPRVAFTGLSLFNEPVSPGDSLSPLRTAMPETRRLELTYEQNAITIEFAALDFSTPGNVRYSYRMRGVDRRWHASGRRRYATYTNLAPGTYTFEVKASNGEPFGEDPAATLEVYVAAPFWAQWWFRITAAVLAALALRWFLRFRARRQAEIDLGRRALYDSLTELANRVLFAERLQQALLRWHRQRKAHANGSTVALTGTAVLFIDLDEFKAVNDRMGHQAGDTVLKVVAERLVQTIRESDTAARFGGDEFAILLGDLATDEDALVVASRIIATVQQPIPTDAGEARVGASVGIAFAVPGTSVETLMAQADEAMYEVKHGGKGNVAVYGAQKEAVALAS